VPDNVVDEDGDKDDKGHEPPCHKTKAGFAPCAAGDTKQKRKGKGTSRPTPAISFLPSFLPRADPLFLNSRRNLFSLAQSNVLGRVLASGFTLTEIRQYAWPNFGPLVTQQQSKAKMYPQPSAVVNALKMMQESIISILPHADQNASEFARRRAPGAEWRDPASFALFHLFPPCAFFRK